MEKEEEMEQSKTILIIDDDVDFQFMVSSILLGKGYKVKSLVAGAFASAAKAARDCDIVLLDMRLPGVSGIDIGKKLKSVPETSEIPIIVVTADHEPDSLYRESKANAIFRKPFSLSGLIKKIEELLSLSPAKKHSDRF
jgi:two-component system, sensor histidine kinase and response regulator